MLYSEGRQGRQENSGALSVALLVFFSSLILGCTDSPSLNQQNLSLDAFSDMKADDYSLNPQSFQEKLAIYCKNGKGNKSVNNFLSRHYENGGTTVWVDKWGVDDRADSLLAFLESESAEMGFRASVFYIAEIKADMEKVRTLTFDQHDNVSQVMARLEYNLNNAYLTYATGQRYGFVNPNNVLNRYDARDKDSTGRAITYRHLYDVDIESPTDSFFNAAMACATIDGIGAFLRQTEPKTELYGRLRQMLRNANSAERQKILVNMERCRWRDKLHVQEQRKYVVVNVPAFHLWAVGPDSVMDMRAACGALKTKTPLLSSQITYMQVNPEWVIPMSIIRDDVARHGGDSNYFARHRYYIADRKTGKRLSPTAVSAAMLRSGNYRVAQEGGAGNSLGRIIFRFPNNFSVFLHDTSSPGVFQRDNRGVSHGCVRVQRPFDLAVFMMEKDPDEWLLDKLRISMGMKPETEQGRKYMDQLDPSVKVPQLVRSINVSPRVPIIITYYTIFLAPDGSLHHYPDVYGYDNAISETLKPYTE